MVNHFTKMSVTERDQAAAACDPDLLRAAQRLVGRSIPGKRFSAALAALHNGNCGACHMKVTTNALNNAKKGTGICENCSTMLYYEG